MPNANLVDLAIGATAILNAASLSKSFVAERTYQPDYNISTTPGLKVFVVPSKVEVDLQGATRNESEETHTIMVGIYNTIGRDDNGVLVTSEVDAMLYFAQEVERLFSANRNVGVGSLIKATTASAYDQSHLEQQEVFLTVVVLDYLVYASR